MLAVRLDALMEEQLSHFAHTHNTTKTQIVKDALINFFKQHKEHSKTPYELGADLFGLDGSGDGTLSTTYKKRFKEKLNAKYRSHR